MFLLVLALPKDSNIGLELRSLSLTFSISPFFSVTSEMYCNTFLDASVFPEPDSPINDIFYQLFNYTSLKNFFRSGLPKFLVVAHSKQSGQKLSL